MQITNTQQGPRGVNTVNGPVLIEPGQTVEVELAKGEIEHVRATGWFEFGKAPAAKQDDSKPLTKG